MSYIAMNPDVFIQVMYAGLVILGQLAPVFALPVPSFIEKARTYKSRLTINATVTLLFIAGLIGSGIHLSATIMLLWISAMHMLVGIYSDIPYHKVDRKLGWWHLGTGAGIAILEGLRLGLLANQWVQLTLVIVLAVVVFLAMLHPTLPKADLRAAMIGLLPMVVALYPLPMIGAWFAGLFVSMMIVSIGLKIRNQSFLRTRVAMVPVFTLASLLGYAGIYVPLLI